MHIILALLLLILNIKKKTWRYYSKYHPCIFYVSFFNLLYYILCKDFLLWDLKAKILRPKVVRGLHIVVIDPLLILLYVSNLPKPLLEKTTYVSKWVVISTLIEWIGQKKFKMISFDNGWHIGWSMWIYIEMYLFSWLINKRPTLTWIFSIISTTHLLYIFKVPLKNNMKKYLKELEGTII